ncbi:hypothetical protein PAXINDRAFT_81470 [Paxillus involutus ATCC 200175]|uniref:Uncharacterized protein n=1 Tax=Paxillus involutus ATCC 200175 TaxID=664439 RepID=A0A0C9U1E5_PAXIN|nr:hypothetical protein PAXINDRAFT_81470 [Paxillus involutus ATCC 200175]
MFPTRTKTVKSLPCSLTNQVDNHSTCLLTEHAHAFRLSELLELRKVRKARQGIGVWKLSKDSEDVKKRRHQRTRAFKSNSDEEDVDAKPRRTVWTSKFTQQTNTLGVDKHMYIFHDGIYRGEQQQDTSESKPQGPNDEFELSEWWKIDKRTANEGSVTNSLSMLTTIAEVDLGMVTQLRNIAGTEKAKRWVVEERKEHKKANNDEEHLVATRCMPSCHINMASDCLRPVYRPHLKQKAYAEIMRDAKVETKGLRPR